MATSAAIFEEAASAYPQHHVDAGMSENLPFLQSTRSAKQDEPEERERQPRPDGLAGEMRRRSPFSKRRPLAPARVSSKAYKLWTVPLAALTVLLVFSALRRRCTSLAKRPRAHAATGAPFRRLARSDSYLAAVCGEGGEEGEDSEVLAEHFGPENPGEVWVPLVPLTPRSPQDRNEEGTVEIDVESNRSDDLSELSEGDALFPRWVPLVAVLNALCVAAVVGLFIQTFMARSYKHFNGTVVENISSIASPSGPPATGNVPSAVASGTVVDNISSTASPAGFPTTENVPNTTTPGFPTTVTSSFSKPANGAPVSGGPSSSEITSSATTPELPSPALVNVSLPPAGTFSFKTTSSLPGTNSSSSGLTDDATTRGNFSSTTTPSPAAPTTPQLHKTTQSLTSGKNVSSTATNSSKNT